MAWRCMGSTQPVRLTQKGKWWRTRLARPRSFALLSMSSFCVLEFDTATMLLLGYLAAM